MLNVAFIDRSDNTLDFHSLTRRGMRFQIAGHYLISDSKWDRVKDTAAEVAEVSVTIWRLVITNRFRFRYSQTDDTIPSLLMRRIN